MGFATTKNQRERSFPEPDSEPSPEGVMIAVSGACMAAIEYMLARSWGAHRLANRMAILDNRASRRGLRLNWNVVLDGREALLDELQRMQDITEKP